MILKQLVVGPIMANCFILGCEETKIAVVIDPGGDPDKILMALAKEKLTVKYILNTHGHFDHTTANARLKEATGAELLIHAADAPMLADLRGGAAAFGIPAEDSPPPDKTIDHGDKIEFGNITLDVIHTPGHSLGGVSFVTGKVAFVGDTLFSGSIGRSDFPGGSYDTLIGSIKKRLFALPNDTKVYTGHGPATTIGAERRSNPFVGGK